MLTTLALAAIMAAPATVAPVNFVHGYKEKDKLTYEMVFGAVEVDIEARITFDLTVGATKDGKTNITISIVEADMGAFGEMDDTDPITLNIDKNGIPFMEELQGNNLLMIALMTTYLPDKKLDVGGAFDFKREGDRIQITGKGKFTGMEKVDGTSFAVLEYEVLGSPADSNEVTLEIKTYYNPASKRVERTSAVVESDGQVFEASLKLKK